MNEYRVTLAHGTVQVTRTVQADSSTDAILAAEDESGFWGAPLHVVEVQRV